MFYRSLNYIRDEIKIHSMEVHFSYQNLNWVILGVGAVIILHMLSIKKSKERAILFANYETLRKVVGDDVVKKDLIPLILRTLAILCFIIALINLKITMVKPVSNVDFVIALDTSPTMLSSDNGNFTPSRLDVAKFTAIKIINSLPPSTKVGIVTFSGKAYIKTGLTNNKVLLDNILESIHLEGPAGTAIGDAILAATSILTKTNRSKVIVLITDGRSNVGVSVNQSVLYAKQYGIKINTIGIGQRNKTAVNITKELMELNLTNILKENATIYTGDYLDEKALIFIANETGGKYFYVKNAKEMLNAFKEAVFKANEVTISLRKYAVLAGLLFLFIEWSLGATKYRTLP